VKRKGDKDWVGIYEGREYQLRGDYAQFREGGEYTVYGTMAPDQTYITTTRVEPFVVRETVRTEPVTYRMTVRRRGNEWIGVHDGRTFVLRGDFSQFRDDGDYTVSGTIGDNDSFGFTTVVRAK
jgi:hypothetical protein